MNLNHVGIGTGTPVLALHSRTPDHRRMRGCLEPVFERQPGYRRLYPDLPGMGRSAAPPSIASSDDVLAAVREFVSDTIGTKPSQSAADATAPRPATPCAATRRAPSAAWPQLRSRPPLREGPAC